MFDAFLSYTTDPDGRLARRVESFLESFHGRVPSLKLAPLQICRDGSDFSIHKRQAAGESPQEIRDVIKGYLANSNRLLVLCSHSARGNPWINKEIVWALELGKPVWFAITEGDPATDPQAFFPPAAVAAGLPHAWYDLRGGRANAGPYRDFEDVLVQIAADLHDRNPGEIDPIWQRERRNAERRKRIGLWAGIVLLMCVAVGLAFLYQKARTEARNARRATAGQLAVQANATRRIAPQQSLLLAVEAVKTFYDAHDPIVPPAVQSLLVSRRLHRTWPRFSRRR